MPPPAHADRPDLGIAEPEPSTGDAQADRPGDDDAELTEASGVEWDALPDAVRARLAEIAAEAIGGLAKVDVPQSVRPVARFAPAKRARLGAGPIIAGLRDSRPFRTAVVEWCREHRPSVLEVNGAE